MDATLATIDPWLIALILAASMLAGWGIGWWIGRKNPADPDDKSSSRFADGTLALLGLLLGFSFALALGKHDQRRLSVIADSNAIADFYTCASLLREPQKDALQDTIRDYVNIRLTVARTKPDRPTVDRLILDSEKLQSRMTNLVAEAVNAGSPISAPLVNNLNNLTSSHASLLAAMRDRLPLEVLLLLLAAAIASTILVGRQHGRLNKVQLTGSTTYILLVALAVYVILDLNQPTAGLITIDTQPLERLANSIKAVPPA